MRVWSGGDAWHIPSRRWLANTRGTTMKNVYVALAGITVFLGVGCSEVPDVQRVMLRCQAREEKCFGFYSFAAGELKPPLADPGPVDLVYYFDGNDCSRGALIGHDDRPGYLFPVGHKSWSELMTLKPPAEDRESVGGILPLTKDKEGLAFWVKSKNGQYTLARIKTVYPASHADLVAGQTATLELEWRRPR